MNKTLGLELVLYGLLLAGLSLLTRWILPDKAQVTLLTGLAGGLLCIIWGFCALLGHRRKAWSLLTLIPVAYVLLSQVVTLWMADPAELPGSRTAALVVTVMLLCSVALLAQIAYTGLLPAGPAAPSHPQPTASRRS